MADLLFVTWDGGGNVPPATTLAHELVERGHTVRFLGHARQREPLTAAGFAFVSPTHTRDFSALERHSPLAMMAALGDVGTGRDLLSAVAGHRTDLVVLDCLVLGAIHAARRAGLPHVVLEHLYDGYYRRGVLGGPLGLSLRLRRLEPHAALESPRVVTTIPELDPVPPAPGVHQVGPVVAIAPRPAPVAHTAPTVLVSLSTFGFPGQRRTLQAVLDATEGLDARVVVTTGPVVDPGEVRAPAGAEVHRFVPHVELFPATTLFVGHGGHGSTMQALAHDVPCLLLPMDRFADQPTVARSVAGAGAGATLHKRADAATIRPVLERLLADGPHRAAAARLGEAVRARPGVQLGADAIESLCVRSAAAG